jgi:hypothetical protein
MRQDMDKVIVERPRRGHRHWPKLGRDRLLEDEDGAPLRARAPRSDRLVKTKELNENLQPLYRYLDKQVGRPWDKVWSEISERLRPTSTVQDHVRLHVRQHVAMTTRVAADGDVEVSGPGWRSRPVKLADAWQKLYVCPRTGLLRRNPHWNNRKKAARERKAIEARQRAARMRIVDARTQLHRLDDGAWWQVTLAPAAQLARSPAWRTARDIPADAVDAVDVVLRSGLSRLDRGELYGDIRLAAVDKRQLSRREAKRRGLA